MLVEAEPAVVGPGEGLSPKGQSALEEALRLVRLEIGRAPLLALAVELRPLVDGDRLEESVALLALRDLLGQLEQLDDQGHWGRTFALRDHFRLGIAHEHSSEGMDHRDWALWWALVEELDRVEAAEAASP